jgi:hypothetical protein
VTAGRGVGLVVRYAGLRDAEVASHHAAWARMAPGRHRDRRTVSVFSPYVDDLLLPQLKELARTYRLDGVVVDGDCWALEADYGKEVGRAFRHETGVRRVPTKPSHKHWPEFADFCREGFRRYLCRYVDELHVVAPECEVASAAAFSHMMPEPVTADVDFLTARVDSLDSVNAARLAGRCLRGQGRPWSLELDACRARPGQACASTKTADQLKQEAAVVLALGGGVAVGLPQRADGSTYAWQMDLAADLATFCRQRRPFCHRAEPVPEIALLCCGRSYYRKGPDLMRPWSGQLDAMQGILQALIGLHYSVEVTMNHHLAVRRDVFPLIVVPEWDDLPPGVCADLLAYVEGGGNLLALGPGAARPFAQALGAAFDGDDEVREQWLAYEGRLAAVKALAAPVHLKGAARAVGRLYDDNEAVGDGRPAGSVIEFGGGKIAAAYLNLGEGFTRAATSVARRFLGALVRELLPRPLVELDRDLPVDVVVNRIEGHLAVNLVNTGGPHADPRVDTFDRVPAVGPLKVRVRAERPERVFLQPGNRHLPFNSREGAVEIDLPRLDLHAVILLEEGA